MPETPVFSSAAVAAPHARASEIGQIILAQGGNAVEAVVAMAATMAVVCPHSSGFGGDGAWLVREPGGRVRAFAASGPAGRLATIARYRDKGYDGMPARGPEAALTVAGAVAGWTLALDYARSVGGRLPLDMLLSDAIRGAREGVPVSASEARCVIEDREALYDAPRFAATFLKEGKPPEAGMLRPQVALSDTLGQLAHAGVEDFYRGDIGREIAADLEGIGAPVTREDLKGYRAQVIEPLSLRYRDATLHALPPPAAGLASLLLLGIFALLKLEPGDTLDHAHGLIEATKRVTAKDFVAEDPATLITDSWLGREAAAIVMRRAAPAPVLSSAEGEASWMGAIDGNGLAVSCMQSLGSAFGSGCVLPATGILWHNPGRIFSLDPDAGNPLEPGRRPLHRLNPALAAFDDGRTLAYGAGGGDGQPQVKAQIFTRYADGGMGLADAVDAPRWLLARSSGAPSATLQVEDRFDPGLLEALAKRGHEVEEIAKPYSDAFGHAGMLLRHAGNGRVEATHDSRTDGSTLGL